MKSPLFTGSGVAIVTPFRDGNVDYEAFRVLLDWQIESGTDAIIVCGTTGEASTLSPDEYAQVVSICVEQVNHRVPVIAGSGSNSTKAAVSRSVEAEKLGVDGLLVVTPYYNKATQSGMVKHFTAIADSVHLPIILYNVPSRTGVSLTAETYHLLSAHKNIVGVKEASGNMALVQETRCLCPADFYIWSGNDEDTVALCALGALGVISVAANIAPQAVHQLTQLCFENDFREAGAEQLQLQGLIRTLFCEVNPIPIKAAMEELGLCSGELRLPLCEISPQNREKLRFELRQFGLIE